MEVINEEFLNQFNSNENSEINSNDINKKYTNMDVCKIF